MLDRLASRQELSCDTMTAPERRERSSRSSLAAAMRAPRRLHASGNAVQPPIAAG